MNIQKTNRKSAIYKIYLVVEDDITHKNCDKK